jgi:Flp pilus assembly protein TadG
MEKSDRSERGQVVIIMALAIVVLLLAAGLAIDGGMLLFGRRTMQNAADAAALAGTRELAGAICDFEAADVTDAAVHSAVLDLAGRNGVSDPNAIQAAYVRFVGSEVVQFDPSVLVGSGSVPQGAAGVVVTTTLTRPTVFMRLIGRDDATAGATATAVTGPPWVAGGMRPFGVPVELAQSNEGDCFTLSFKNCDEDAPLGDPDGCFIYDDDGNIIGQHRNWLNLGYVWREPDAYDWYRAVDTAPDADDIKEWMCDGWSGTLYTDCRWETEGCQTGDFIHAAPGTTSSGIGVVSHQCAEVFGQPILVPIYDVVPHYDQIETEKPGPAGAGNYYYHIVGFGAVRIEEDEGDCETSQGAGLLCVCVDEAIIGQGQTSPNSGFGSDICVNHTLVVTLWH